MTFREKRLYLVACVAVTSLLFVGCSKASDSATNKTKTPSTSTTAVDVPDTTQPSSPSGDLGTPLPGYDEWKQWKSNKSSPALDVLFKQLGLSEGSLPNEERIGRGYVGIAKLGDACIVAFLSGLPSSDLPDVAILSRFTPYGLTKVLQGGDLEGIRRFIDDYRLTCTTGTPA